MIAPLHTGVSEVFSLLSIFALLFLLVLPSQPVGALTLSYREIFRYEVDPAVNENFSRKGIPIGSEGKVYITDTAAGLHVHLANIEHLDAYTVIFRYPSGEIAHTSDIWYDDNTHCFFSRTRS